MTVEEATKQWAAELSEAWARHNAKHFPNVATPTAQIDEGPKYLRICRADGVSRSAFAFVSRSDGFIWKPAGFKGPAKNFPRGNVLSLDRPVSIYGF